VSAIDTCHTQVGKDGKISHQRVNIMKDRSGFYVYLKSSKGQKKIEAAGGLEVLINTVRPAMPILGNIT
jgi:hypothetical protein